MTATPVYAERLVVSTDSPALGERVTATVVPADSYATYQWSLVDANGNETALTNATFSYFTPSYNHVGYWLKVTATYQRGARLRDRRNAAQGVSRPDLRDGRYPVVPRRFRRERDGR